MHLPKSLDLVNFLLFVNYVNSNVTFKNIICEQYAGKFGKGLNPGGDLAKQKQGDGNDQHHYSKSHFSLPTRH